VPGAISQVLVRGAAPLRDELRREVTEFKRAQRVQMRKALAVVAQGWKEQVRSKFKTSGTSYSLKSRKRVGRLEDVKRSVLFEGSAQTSLTVIGRIRPRVSWAAVHEFGKTITTRGTRTVRGRLREKKPYLVFIVGGRFVREESVKIPPRPFVDATVQAKASQAVDIIGEAFGVFSEGRGPARAA
jgi:phage gpG-like protein